MHALKLLQVEDIKNLSAIKRILIFSTKTLLIISCLFKTWLKFFSALILLKFWFKVCNFRICIASVHSIFIYSYWSCYFSETFALQESIVMEGTTSFNFAFKEKRYRFLYSSSKKYNFI